MRLLFAILCVLVTAAVMIAAPPKAPPVALPPKAPPVVEEKTYRYFQDSRGQWWRTEVAGVASGPFLPGTIIPATTAPLAGVRSTSFRDSTVTAPTTTLVPRVGRLGGTNCST